MRATPGQQGQALMMITPDAVVQGLTGRVLDRVEVHGFRPVRYREIRLTPERRSALHGTRPGGAPGTDLGALLYGLAPTRVVLLAGPDGAGDAAQRLTALAGSPVPHRADPGSLRRDLGALNPFCALVRTAEDAAAVQRWSAALLADAEPSAGPLAGLTRARCEAPTPTPLWTTLREAADRLLQRCGGAPVRDAWPDDAEGPSSGAMGRLSRLWDDMADRLRVGNPDAAAWMDGIRAGHVSYSGWHNLCGPATSTADWATYLAFTTVRSLDLRVPAEDRG